MPNNKKHAKENKSTDDSPSVVGETNKELLMEAQLMRMGILIPPNASLTPKAKRKEEKPDAPRKSKSETNLLEKMPVRKERKPIVTNPLMEGYMNVKTKGQWKGRYIVVDKYSIYIFKSPEQTGKCKQISLMLSTPKPYPKKKRVFHLMTKNGVHKFETAADGEVENWIKGIQEVCNALTIESIGNNQTNDKKAKEELLKLQKLPENRVCADCKTPDPEWASTNLGIFICIQCSGLHRNLGTHISKVKSLTLDAWKAEEIEHMKGIGNNRANEMWEANVPPDVIKPTIDSPINLKQEWVVAKYELELFHKAKTPTTNS